MKHLHIHAPHHHHSRPALLEKKPGSSPAFKQYCQTHKEGWKFSESTSEAVGELYVAVLGGTGIVDGELGTSSFVSLRLEGAGWDFRTRVVEAKDPQWNEEFIFAVRDKSQPLLINVHGSHPLKNLGIAKTSIDLKRVPDDELMDFVLTLDPFWGPTHGQVHLKVRFTPERIPSLSGFRLPSFRVVLENSKVFAGDTVRGYVCFNTHEPNEIVSIRLKLRGSSTVYWSGAEFEDYPSYEAELIYFDQVANIYGPPNDAAAKMTLPAGCHAWPFQFQLPRNTPPSFSQEWKEEDETEKGENSYFVHAYIKTHHDREHYDESRQKITVLTPNKYIVSRADTHVQEKGDEYVHINIDVPSVVYIGEPFTAQVTIDNKHTSHKVSEVKVEIVKSVLMHAGSCHPKHLNIQHGSEFKFTEPPHTRHYTDVVLHNKIHRSSESYILPGDSWTGGATFIFRDSTEPSMPIHTSQLVQVNYEIKVTASIHGMTFLKAKANKPLMVLHRTSGAHQQIHTPVEGEEPETSPAQFKTFQLSEDDLYKILSLPVKRCTHQRIFELDSLEWPKNVQGHLHEPEQWSLGQATVEAVTATIVIETPAATTTTEQAPAPETKQA